MPVALFDLDNTLLDRQAAFARWARSFCDGHGLPDDAWTWLVSADDDGMCPRDVLFSSVRTRFAVVDPVADLVDAYHRDYPEAFEFPADSRAALRRLRSVGWKVAVVTNGPQSQERKLA